MLHKLNITKLMALLMVAFLGGLMQTNAQTTMESPLAQGAKASDARLVTLTPEVKSLTPVGSFKIEKELPQTMQAPKR